MAEELSILTGSRKEVYEGLLPQIEALTFGESNLTANLANVAGALHQTFGFLWVGFYLVDSSDELVLGPFQGPIACTRIKKGKGVCGSAWAEEKSYLVPDVDAFPGHIACSSDSKSEVVIPIFNKNREVMAVLDVDSSQLNDFSETDVYYLEKIAVLITSLIP